MAHTVEPYVIMISKPQVIPKGVYDWLTQKGVSPDAMDAILNRGKTEGEKLIELAGRRCYMSYEPGLNPNVRSIRKNILSYITNILEVRHGSVLTHAFYTFAIENVSRVLTGELNRHSVGTSISEGSMRYIRYTDIPYWIPTCIQGNETQFVTNPELKDARGWYVQYRSKEEAHRESLARIFEFCQKEYSYQAALWKDDLEKEGKEAFHKKKELTSCMRRGIPMGVATGGVWTMNLRALRNILEQRCSDAAEEEILLVATMILNLMRDAEPSFFADFTTDEKGFSAPKFSKV